jgi:hypothetical protein
VTELTVCKDKYRICVWLVNKTVFFVCFHVTEGWPEADMSTSIEMDVHSRKKQYIMQRRDYQRARIPQYVK